MEGEKFIDIEQILRDKATRLYKWMPGFAIGWLKRRLHEDQINEAMAAMANYSVVKAVIMIGAMRSRAPRITSSEPKAMPSSCSRCWKWLIIMIPLRVAMPNRVMNPPRDAIDSVPPDRKTITTPPIRANGRFAITSPAPKSPNSHAV